MRYGQHVLIYKAIIIKPRPVITAQARNTIDKATTQEDCLPMQMFIICYIRVTPNSAIESYPTHFNHTLPYNRDQ